MDAGCMMLACLGSLLLFSMLALAITLIVVVVRGGPLGW